VNDVVVSLIAGSLGNYLRRRGEDTCGLRIRAMVPVNLRAADDTAMSGNRFSLVYLELPVGVTDARERLMKVKIEMDRIKGSMEPEVGWLLVQSLGLVPTPIEQMASAFYARKASLVLTNVMGPAKRIYLAGSPIRQMTFWEPESGGLGLGVSIFSYAGEITVGVVADRNLVADPDQIARGVVTEFAKLGDPGDRG
jgi:WS/DGAT/MGAT family acyltransferase